MNAGLDWAAPIIPGKAMMGLALGTSWSDVLARLRAHAVNPETHDLIQFANSPVLRIDIADTVGTHIALRAADIIEVNYAWQDEVASLGFEDDVLTWISVYPAGMRPDIRYAGRAFGKLGLGDQIADLNDHCRLEYYDDEERFYTDGEFRGLTVSGTACDLPADPKQVISVIRIISVV